MLPRGGQEEFSRAWCGRSIREKKTTRECNEKNTTSRAGKLLVWTGDATYDTCRTQRTLCTVHWNYGPSHTGSKYRVTEVYVRGSLLVINRGQFITCLHNRLHSKAGLSWRYPDFPKVLQVPPSSASRHSTGHCKYSHCEVACLCCPSNTVKCWSSGLLVSQVGTTIMTVTAKTDEHKQARNLDAVIPWSSYRVVSEKITLRLCFVCIGK